MIKHNEFKIKGSNNKYIIGDITLDNSCKSQGLIIFVHGFKGFKDWGAHNLVAKYFAQNGYKYVKFNLSHSGVPVENPVDVTDLNAFASNTISYELADVKAVIDYISETEAGPIYLIGHSRGGGLAIIEAAQDNRIRKLITWSAIADFSSLWKKEQEAEWLKTGQIFVTNARTKEQMPLNKTLLEDFNQHKEAYNILNAAGRIGISWLIIHGTADVNVPFSVAEELKKANTNSNLVKIEGANHVYNVNHPYLNKNLSAELQQVCETCLSFLKD